jgi:putative tricarboxylic transport membrane protein
VDLWKSIDKSELACGAVLVGLGVFVVRESAAWEYMTPDGPGPGFFPLWIGLATIALSVLYIGLLAYDVVREQPVHRTNWTGTGRVLAGWAAFMIAAALLKPAGFIVSFALLVVFLVRVIFARPFVAAFAVGLGSAFGFWVLFVKLLNVRLPTGPWGF